MAPCVWMAAGCYPDRGHLFLLPWHQQPLGEVWKQIFLRKICTSQQRLSPAGRMAARLSHETLLVTAGKS
ncbi:hypothetical protein XELAEV_18017307mg [Xenopus laevis]|uniref:Uncharacterized protein n=1 Tax=Xenopus laevis TaxID=8355 RepID=A0A974DCW3_XENLA|nr:hypothetical protein XELAEV_18017307mg [Xenopus laevis]